jgi:hypothetical protein
MRRNNTHWYFMDSFSEREPQQSTPQNGNHITPNYGISVPCHDTRKEKVDTQSSYQNCMRRVEAGQGGSHLAYLQAAKFKKCFVIICKTPGIVQFVGKINYCNNRERLTKISKDANMPHLQAPNARNICKTIQ